MYTFKYSYNSSVVTLLLAGTLATLSKIFAKNEKNRSLVKIKIGDYSHGLRKWQSENPGVFSVQPGNWVPVETLGFPGSTGKYEGGYCAFGRLPGFG